MAAESTIRLYVRLLDEGTDVFRPTMAVSISADTARLLPTEHYDPELEDWEFKPGSVVRFKRVSSSDGDQFVAVALSH